MNFVYPGFLWALGALAIPVVIHLFSFRQTTRVLFSTTRYLKHIKEVSTTRRRLKHLLILASRLLFLFFLVLAFSQPFIPAQQQEGLRRNVVFYLDNSLSMSAQSAESTRALDEGIAYINEVLEVMPAENRFKLITNDFLPSANTYKTKGEIAELLTQIRLSPVGRQAEEVQSRIAQGQENKSDLEVFWISDFQKSTLGPPVVSDSLTLWQLIPVRPLVSDNVFVDSVYMANPFSIGSEQSQVNVQLRNDGQKDLEAVNVRLSVNGIQTATTSIPLPAKASGVATLDINTRLQGLNQAHVSFADFPISFDNDFYFTLNFSRRIQVIEVKASAATTPVERVYGNAELFNYRGFTADNFNYSLLGETDLVVINGLDRMPSGLLPVLGEYLSAGGTLLMIPGANPALEEFQALVGAPFTQLNEPAKQELEAPIANHPFFKDVFEAAAAPVVMPGARRVLDWGADRSAILKFKNDKPFLSVFERSGHVYIMASPLEASFSDLASNALFVPVMYKLAAGAQKGTGRLYHTLNESFIEQAVDSLNPDLPLRLVGDVEVVPSQRVVNGRVFMELPKFLLNPGFYHLLMGRDTVNLVAFDLSKLESQMDHLASEEVISHFGGGDHMTILEAGSIEAFSKEIKARYLGRPLWKYALALSLLFLLAEVLLIRFMK
jgi:hypothetical protein